MRTRRGGRQHVNEYSPEYLKTHFRLGAPEGWVDGKTDLAQLREQERYAQAAPLRAAAAKVQGLRDEIAEVNAELLWWRDTPFGEMTTENAPVDLLTDYAMRPEGPPPMALEFREQWDEAYSQFARELDAKNIVFSPESGESVQKLAGFITVLYQKRGIALTAGNFFLAFRKLVSLGVIVPDKDVSGFVETEAIPSQYQVIASMPLPEQLQAQQQAPQKSQAQIDDDTIEHMDTSTRAGQAAAKALHWRGWSAEVQRMYLDWAENNMSAIWGVPLETMTSPEIVDWVGEFFIRNQLNPFRADSYDKARLAGDWNQIFPGFSRGALLLASEKLARSIENSDLGDIEVRQNINRRAAEIAKATAPRLK